MDQAMTLHGYFRSSAAWRVRIALGLKGLTAAGVFRHLRKGEQSAPDHLALNPQGLVPTLEVAGQGVLTQSLAIVEWLDETQPGAKLLPADPWGRARARALAEIVACDIHPIQNLRVLQYLKREMGQDQAAIDGFDRQPDRPDQQGKAHHCAGERRTSPAKREHDPEVLVQERTDRAAPSEAEEEQIAGHDRRQDERQQYDAVDDRFSGEARAREQIGDCDADRQAG